MQHRSQGESRVETEKRITLTKLVVIVFAMFGFGFALVPIYRTICEVTGINVLTRKSDEEEKIRSTQVDTSRQVVVEFDGNAQGGWKIRPEVSSLTVHPGELATVHYKISNTLPRPSAGQAIPSYAPEGVGRFFVKLECFCFQQQALGANETRDFQVVFVVDPTLPTDVTTITLSYAFFEVDGPAAAVRGAGATAGSGV